MTRPTPNAVVQFVLGLIVLGGAATAAVAAWLGLRREPGVVIEKGRRER